MRAFVLLLLVALSFFLVVTYYPSSTVQGAGVDSGSEQQPPEAELPEKEQLAPAAPPKVASNPFRGEPAPAQAVEQPASTEETADWLSGVALGRALAPGEMQVAAALVHGGSLALQSALVQQRAFPTNKANLAKAFAMALEGKFDEAMQQARALDLSGLESREQELLKLGLEGKGLGSIDSAPTGAPFELAMEMSLCAYGGELALRQREYGAAVQAFSSVIVAELDSPWEADSATLKRWTESLNNAQRNYRWNPKGQWPSADMVVQPGESPIAVRLRYLSENPGEIMCTGLFLKSNGISNHIIQPGQTLRIPTGATSVLVDLSARWALLLMGDEVVGSWPVGIGRADHDTPAGHYTAGNKLENPPWMRVGKEPIPFGDERNPLGTRWIGWFRDGVKTAYGLHGTKDPTSIGTPSSLGCIRFHNRDIELIFDILPIGSPIYVRE